MNVLVHLLFARHIHAAVCEQIGVRLSWRGFLYGNILPDLSAKYDTHPHFVDESLAFALGCASALYDQAGDKRLGAFGYAKDIGVVTHYLSDFCCHAHTKQFSGDMKQHHWYEWKMLFAFDKGLSQYRTHLPDTADTLEAFTLFLKRSLREQQNGLPSGVRDVFYAMKVSTVMVLLLLRRAVYTQAILLYHANEMYAFQQQEEDWHESRLFL
ncbi:MAG: zinc dependent phospholipase C family protein [Ethanoligenens sp.]|uniref:zinc dependent phospholipase C family protein n=1 Tax=Ethanoligenens sp. TaxID=2099655 RepID=UPI0039EC19C9